MLWVAACPNLMITFRGPKKIHAQNGEVVETRPRVRAPFTHGPVPEWAGTIAKERLDFRGMPSDMVPEQFMSSFDSDVSAQLEGWTKEEKEALEHFLLTKADQTQYILVEQPKAGIPWRTYDKIVVHGRRSIEHVAAEIADITEKTGVDPDVVIAYEQENLNRAEVIDAVARITETIEETVAA